MLRSILNVAIDCSTDMRENIKGPVAVACTPALSQTIILRPRRRITEGLVAVNSINGSGGKGDIPERVRMGRQDRCAKAEEAPRFSQLVLSFPCTPGQLQISCEKTVSA
jgi:hypothetical protein